jgi:hypothetical protein
MTKSTSSSLLICLSVYTVATALHYIHNAVFLSSYPNIPDWLSRAEVYSGLVVVIAIGAVGCLLYLFGYRVMGLIVIGAYAALGFDGLAHYSLAPVSSHTFMMNLTILSETITALVLLTVVISLFSKRVFGDRVGSTHDA